MSIITRTVFILSLVSMFADIASEMLYPVMPVYLREIGFSVLWIGILEGFVNFTAGISKGYFGKRSDEIGLRLPFVKFGYLLSAISKPMMAVFTYPIWIFFSRTLDRLGKGMRVASRDAILSSATTIENKARVFGFHRSLDTVGAAIGPTIALIFLLAYPGHYAGLFYIAAIPGLISVALVFLLREKKQPVSTLGKGNFFSFFKYWKIAGKEYKILVSGLLLFALFNSSDIFLLLKTREALGDQSFVFLGQEFTSDSITIAAYIFYNLVFALTSYPMGMLADRIGYKKVFIGGLLVFAIVYLGFAGDPSIAGLFLLFFVYGIYASATEGVAKAWITNLSHHHDTATAVGFYTSAESICALVASIIAGLVWAYFGSFYTFSSTALVAIFVAVFFMLKIKKKYSS